MQQDYNGFQQEAIHIYSARFDRCSIRGPGVPVLQESRCRVVIKCLKKLQVSVTNRFAVKKKRKETAPLRLVIEGTVSALPECMAA